MYPCPSCGGGLRFDIPSQKLKCDFCQTAADPSAFQTLKGAEEEKDFEVTKFICSQCGAEIISQDQTAAAFCSFCGASTLLKSRLSREKKPDAIIPFKKTKEDCISSYRKMMRRALFAPNELKDESCINSFRGIYMPYWVYDVSHKGAFCLRGEKYSRSGDYDITRHYDLTGVIDADYQGITHDASSEFSDDISESLAPYNVREMQRFNPAYLSGFYADTYDVSSRVYDQDAAGLAGRISYEHAKKIPVFKGYSMKSKHTANASLFHTTMNYPHYALFPVWFMSYRKNDRVSYVSINGQTGKITSDIPIDYKKYTLCSLLLTIPVFFLLNFVVFMKAKSAMIVSALLLILSLILSFREIAQIVKKESGAGDRGLFRGSAPQKIKIPFSETWKRFMKDKFSVPGILTSFCAIAASAVIFILNPVSDYYYYLGAAFSIIAVFLTIITIMRNYNILSTRKLPQFNREGGDDRAPEK